jgi:GT2 family glycosyltransferase
MPPTESDPRPSFVPPEPISIPGAPGLVSVVVLCCGQLEHTRLCAPSVLRFSRPPFEIIAVDSGALDGTAEYWSGVQAAASCRVELVRSSAESELGAALRAGLDRVGGEAVVLLANDTIVPNGWLNQLTALLNSNPALGMVAPMTTFGPGHQVVWPVPYRLGARAAVASGPDEVVSQIGLVDRFAADWREQHRGQWADVDRLGGGCVMLRRSALRAVGAIPSAPLRFFEPEALSRRVLAAGFRLACCRDLFVHSFGTRSVAPVESGAFEGAR